MKEEASDPPPPGGEFSYLIQQVEVQVDIDMGRDPSFGHNSCVKFANSKVEDKKMGWVWLEEDTGPPNLPRFEGSCQVFVDLQKSTQVNFLTNCLMTACG